MVGARRGEIRSIASRFAGEFEVVTLRHLKERKRVVRRREKVPPSENCRGGGVEAAKSGHYEADVRLLLSSKDLMELARESLARSWNDLMLFGCAMGDLDL